MKEQMLKDYLVKEGEIIKKGEYVTLKVAGENYLVSNDGGWSYFALFSQQERKEYIGYPQENP